MMLRKAADTIDAMAAESIAALHGNGMAVQAAGIVANRDAAKAALIRASGDSATVMTIVRAARIAFEKVASR